jgi:hypothetical protein
MPFRPLLLCCTAFTIATAATFVDSSMQYQAAPSPLNRLLFLFSFMPCCHSSLHHLPTLHLKAKAWRPQPFGGGVSKTRLHFEAASQLLLANFLWRSVTAVGKAADESSPSSLLGCAFRPRQRAVVEMAVVLPSLEWLFERGLLGVLSQWPRDSQRSGAGVSSLRSSPRPHQRTDPPCPLGGILTQMISPRGMFCAFSTALGLLGRSLRASGASLQPHREHLQQCLRCFGLLIS